MNLDLLPPSVTNMTQDPRNDCGKCSTGHLSSMMLLAAEAGKTGAAEGSRDMQLDRRDWGLISFYWGKIKVKIIKYSKWDENTFLQMTFQSTFPN